MENKYYDSRDEIMHSWFQRGEKALKEENIFEAFIYLWISWVVACKKSNGFNYSTEFRFKKDETDREEIKLFCQGNCNSINEILQNHKTSMDYLANRKGSKYRNAIIDASEGQRKKFHELMRDIKGEINLSERQRAGYFAELLNRIRNNLFHGDKIYNDHEDRELIKNTVYILRDFAMFAMELNWM